MFSLPSAGFTMCGVPISLEESNREINCILVLLTIIKNYIYTCVIMYILKDDGDERRIETISQKT